MQLQTISKALLAAAAGSLFALGTSPAFAQDTADLTVKGAIVPAACSANFTGGDTVDFGTIKVVDLLPNSYNPLGTKSTELNLTCSSAKRVTFSMADAQATTKITAAGMYDVLGLIGGQRSPTYVFGLGTGHANGSAVNLGNYVLVPGTSIIDSVNYRVLYSGNNGATWNSAATSHLVSQGLHSIGNSQPVSGTNFIIPMTVQAVLNKGSELQVASDTPLNGQAVFTINYQ
ncbi:DUF1120 domain-containing protein [Ralstonia sp. SET104]|uniref:DUF1120 domain-containing protein n=1 Tax=Ralstonia sp. SET104 TaxID=2448774 RepID=UPI000FF96E49|nr:DUF1120 domain-containing protein [Ralstonia sp. SET104]GCB06825.1 hypothetical protein PSUB009319_44560 [Ralstonia sp. SET104]